MRRLEIAWIAGFVFAAYLVVSLLIDSVLLFVDSL
jgi:hypothetical protein